MSNNTARLMFEFDVVECSHQWEQVSFVDGVSLQSCTKCQDLMEIET